MHFAAKEDIRGALIPGPLSPSVWLFFLQPPHTLSAPPPLLAHWKENRDVEINMRINCHMVFIVEARFLQKILVIRKEGR